MTKRKPPEEKIKTGRPTKMTAANRAILLRNLGTGLALHQAAATAGMSEETLRVWRRDDPEFSAEVDAAMAEAEARKVLYIEKQAATSWKAAAWLLSKANPARYGDRVAHTGPDGGALTIRVVYEDEDAGS